MSNYTANVRGMNFRPEEARQIAFNLQSEDKVKLVREPSNPHDENAIAVMVQGNHIGYVAKEIAALAASEMDAAGVGEIEGSVDIVFGKSIIINFAT